MSEITIIRDTDDLRFVHGDTEIGRYRVVDDTIPPVDTPKPYFHPLRTVGGVTITGFAPADHPWHHGLEFAFPRVGAHNLWGGGTYFGPERGYVVVDDQGHIQHDEWTDVDDAESRFSHRLTWSGHDGERLVTEERAHRLSTVTAGATEGWMLQLDTSLRNATDTDLLVETPAQRGRVDGGYGGWFLRFAEGFSATTLTGDGRPIDESGASAETFVIEGRTATGEEVTVGMRYGPGSNPGVQRWLYRFEPFALAGFAVAYEEGLVIPVNGDLTFSHRIACFDGWVAQDQISAALRS